MASIFAYTEQNRDSKVINIEEAIKEQDHLGRKTYYDIVTLEQAHSTNRTKSKGLSSFTNRKSHSMGGVGIPHQLVQNEIYKLKSFKFKAYGKQFNILIKEVSLEYSVIEGKYRVDCLLHLRPTCKFYNFFNGMIAIEVTDTHKTDQEKIDHLRRAGFWVLEIGITGRKSWHLDDKDYTIKDYNRISGYIRKYLQSNLKLRCLSSQKWIEPDPTLSMIYKKAIKRSYWGILSIFNKT